VWRRRSPPRGHLSGTPQASQQNWARHHGKCRGPTEPRFPHRRGAAMTPGEQWQPPSNKYSGTRSPLPHQIQFSNRDRTPHVSQLLFESARTLFKEQRLLSCPLSANGGRRSQIHHRLNVRPRIKQVLDIIYLAIFPLSPLSFPFLWGCLVLNSVASLCCMVVQRVKAEVG